jgi:hypothetical protein
VTEHAAVRRLLVALGVAAEPPPTPWHAASRWGILGAPGGNSMRATLGARSTGHDAENGRLRRLPSS